MVDDHEVELSELLKEVRHIEVQSNRLVAGAMAGGYSSVFRGAGIEFDEVREYADGDDPRTVDWNVTARIGRPFVKKYVDERELTVIFLLDLSASMIGGFGVWSARQMAARVCACLALSAIKNNDKVGLIAFSDKVDKYIPPDKGTGHALRIVRDCLALKGRSIRTDLARPLEFAAGVVRKRAILFLVSDFLIDPQPPSPASAGRTGNAAGAISGRSSDSAHTLKSTPRNGWQETLSLCARHHDLIAVRLLAPELAPPHSGLLRARDPETGGERVIDWRSKSARDAYTKRVASWRKQLALALRRAHVDLIDVPIPRIQDRNAVVRPILKFFKMRERRGMRR